MKPNELRSIRETLGHSAARFAELVGASDGRMIRRYEAGDYRVPRAAAIIARLLGKGKICESDIDGTRD